MKAHGTLWGYCAGDQWLAESTGLHRTSCVYLFSLAQGRPDALRWTCMLVCALFVHVAHETAGAARTRSSLRPLIGEGKEISGKARAERAARSRSCVLDRDAPHIHNRHSGMRHLAQARNPSRGRVGGSMDSGLSPSGCPG